MKMFATAVCFLFLLKSKWPKDKSIYDVTVSCSWYNCACLNYVHIEYASINVLCLTKKTYKIHYGNVVLLFELTVA